MNSSRIVFGQVAGAWNATSPMLTRISASAIMLPLAIARNRPEGRRDDHQAPASR